MWRSDRELYPYQQEAFKAALDTNLLIAYEMGLGKTPMALAVIEELRAQGVVTRPGIVLAPKTLLRQWRNQIAKFTTSRCVLVEGTPKKRVELYADALSTTTAYVLMTYDTFVRDTNVETYQLDVDAYNGFMICDEATAIKAFKSQRSARLKDTRTIFPIRMALTGTPVENGKLEELFSIMAWVEPRVLGKYWDFERRYIRRNPMGWVERYVHLDEFHEQISGNVLRKKADDPDVAAYLPKVVHMEPLRVTLDAPNRRAYDELVAELAGDLDALVEEIQAAFTAVGDDHPDGQMMSKITAARMLLDWPKSVAISAANFRDPETSTGSEYAAILDDRVDLPLLKTPKMNALLEYLNEFLSEDPANKVVVFASFVSVVEEIVRRLGMQCIGAVGFTGKLDSWGRASAVETFTDDPSCRVFVSSDAGGSGLDLPVANLLVNYDLPWQPGQLAQRNARIRRASSEWGHITVQDILVDDTIEERLLQMHEHKTAISTAVLDGEGITAEGTLLSDLESLRSFLGVPGAMSESMATLVDSK